MSFRGGPAPASSEPSAWSRSAPGRAAPSGVGSDGPRLDRARAHPRRARSRAASRSSRSQSAPRRSRSSGTPTTTSSPTSIPSHGSGDIYVARVSARRVAPRRARRRAADAGPERPAEPGHDRRRLPRRVARGERRDAPSSRTRSAPTRTPVGSGVTIAATQSNQSRPVLARAPAGQGRRLVDGHRRAARAASQVALVDPTSLRRGHRIRQALARRAETTIDGWPWVAGDDQTLGMAWSDAPGGRVRRALRRARPRRALTASSPVSIRGAAPAATVSCRASSARRRASWRPGRTCGRATTRSTWPSSIARARKIGGGLVEEPDSGDANWPNMAWTGSAAGIVYYQFRTGRPQIFMSFVDATGARVARPA